MKSAGGEGWSNAADRRRDVEQILLVRRSLSKNDGGEGIPSKPVGWTERFPLQVNRRMPPFNHRRDKIALSHYFFAFRDDGFRLWDALRRYVEGVVQVAYPTEQVD